MSRVEKVEKVRLGDHLDFSNGHTSGHTSPASEPGGRYPVYGANGVIGYSAQHNARGPLIVVGRVGSYCGSLRYCDSDVWVTDNALACRAKKPEETRYWYYALLGFGLNRYRAGSGQPLLSQGVLRNVSVSAVAAPDRPRIGEILGAFDDKIAANDRVIEAAEALMLAIVGRLSAYVPLSSLASRSTACLDAQHRRPLQFRGIRRRRPAQSRRWANDQERKARRVAAVCVVPETESKNPANLEHHQPPVGNGAGEYGVRRAAASRRRHFGPVGGAATTRCPGRTAAVSRGHDGKPATNPTDPAVAGLGARCAPVDSRTRGRNREPGCAVQRAAD